ncbi:MAG: D-alanyl-D-alanine carboxypeptidase/D-alanyl-D-alanine-endopeptidase [Ignavibacteriae bacterium]|nr:D-alanyl-D-alanine carboxypeptidase/D-alanyl-D-alanine-endopeptidase [Ignavibacteriota bacterium]
MKKLFFYFHFLIIFNLSLSAQSIKKIQQIISAIPSSTKIAVSIINANTGKLFFEKNNSVPLIPASNTKLFTTAGALYLMGNQHLFETQLLSEDSDFTDSIINGNLYIKGYGNSTFTENDLDSLILNLKEIGISEITGNIIADDTYFDNLYMRDEWIVDEHANVKLPPISALVLNRNQIVVTLSSKGKIGTKLKYSISPDAPFIDVEMFAKVTKLRSQPSFNLICGNEKISLKISGGLRKKSTQSSYVVNVDNPPLFISLLLREKLFKNGIKILGKSTFGKSPNNLTEITSKELHINKLISLINKNSNNYLAECLFKSVGAFFSGEEGNSFYATQAILTTFEEDNVIDDQTAVVDGSGISRFNTITTGSISRLLYKIYKDKIYFNDFYNSLAIYGIDGTLRDRSNFKFLKDNFRGKTGTLNGVTALSGYLKNSDNTDYIVSIIMEYKTKSSYYYKDIEDKILMELSK